MIKFKNLVVKGFGSIVEETEFKLNRPNLNVIIADNGSGKTSFFSAWYWTLYGITLKESKTVLTWEHIRPSNYQGCISRTTFKKDKDTYEVIRCKDYKGQIHGAKGNNRLMLLINGELSTIRDIKPLQAEINRILGYSSKLFINTVMFGQNVKRIMDETGPNKKEIFEEAFESGFIKEGKEKADKDLKAKVEERNSLERKVDKLKADKDKYKSIISFEVEQQKNWEKDIESSIKEVEIKIARAEKKVKEKFAYDIEGAKKGLIKYKAKLESYDDTKFKALERQSFELDLETDDVISLADDLNSELERELIAFSNIKTKCSVCKGPLSSENIKKEKDKSKAKIQDIRDKLKAQKLKIPIAIEKRDALRAKLSSATKNKSNEVHINKKIKSYNSIVSLHKTYQIEVEVAKTNLITYNDELKILKEKKWESKVGKIKEELKATKKELKPSKLSLKALNREIKDLQWLISEALGNKGLRAYIFDTMLQGLNEKLAYYEQYIGYRVEFNVDLDSANKDIYTVCYINDNMVELDDLSGGQQRTVNICTLFAMHDLISEDKPINVMIFDEVFDSLDARNTDLIQELINEKAESKSLYMITHRLEFQSSSNKIIRMHLNKQGHTVLKTLVS